MEVFDDQDTSTVVVLKFDRKAWEYIALSFGASWTENLTCALERHFPRSVCTREMVKRLSTLSVGRMIRASKRRAFKVTYRALIVAELLEGKEEVVKLTADDCSFIFGALVDLCRPHSTVYVDKLIHLERNQTTSDSLLSRLLTQDTGELDLRIHYYVVWSGADFGRWLRFRTYRQLLLWLRCLDHGDVFDFLNRFRQYRLRKKMDVVDGLANKGVLDPFHEMSPDLPNSTILDRCQEFVIVELIRLEPSFIVSKHWDLTDLSRPSFFFQVELNVHVSWLGVNRV